MITGNGTEESPYIVNTYSELVEKADISGTFIEISKEIGTINIEDEFGHEEPPTLHIEGNVNINGNGCIIHGLWSRTQSLITLGNTNPERKKSTLKNFTFDSLYVSGNSLIEDVSAVSTPNSARYHQFEVDNCIFSGVCDSSSLLNLKQTYNAGYSGRGFTIKNSTMNLRLNSIDNVVFAVITRTGTVGASSNEELTLSNSIIKLSSSGNISLVTRAGSGSQTIYATAWNCLFDLSATNFSTVVSGFNARLSGCMFLGDSPGGIKIPNTEIDVLCVYDNGAFHDTDESEKFIGVSENNITNSAYLASLGFPIAGNAYG